MRLFGSWVIRLLRCRLRLCPVRPVDEDGARRVTGDLVRGAPHEERLDGAVSPVAEDDQVVAVLLRVLYDALCGIAYFHDGIALDVLVLVLLLRDVVLELFLRGVFEVLQVGVENDRDGGCVTVENDVRFRDDVKNVTSPPKRFATS